MEKLRAHIPLLLLDRIGESSEANVQSTSEDLHNVFHQNPLVKEMMYPLSKPGMTECAKDYSSAMNHKLDGNRAFGDGNFKQSTSYYTKALRFMPVDSTMSDLAVLYVNRATSLHKLKLYAEGLRDCTRAIAVKDSYSKAWYRRSVIKCEIMDFEGALADMQDAYMREATYTGKKQIEHELQHIRQNLHKRVKPGEQDSDSKANIVVQTQIEKYWTSEKQWGLRTTIAVQAGTLVHVEDALAAVILKDKRNTHCHHCFDKLPLDSIVCEGCTVALYCSEPCRDNSKVYHRIECGGTGWAAVLPVDVVLASRILCSELQVELCHHYNKLSYHSKIELHLLAITVTNCVHDYFRHQTSPALTAKLVLLIAQVRSNAMAIVQVYPSESELHNVSSIEHAAVAQALYPQASKFNHSCSPNSFASYFKRTLRVHATRALPAFTPLELSYGPQVGEAGRCERQKWLRDQYYFDCNCESCIQGTFSDILDSGYRCGISSCKGIVLHGNIADAQQILENRDVANVLSSICDTSLQDKDISNLQAGSCLKCKSVMNVEQAAISGRKCMEDLQRLESNLIGVEMRQLLSDTLRCVEQGRKCFHPFNKRMAKMEDFIARLYCEAHQPLDALEHAKESTKIIEYLYGKDHIAVAYERLKLATVAKLAGLSHITKACIEIVNNIFTRYYGGNYTKDFPHLKKLIINN